MKPFSALWRCPRLMALAGLLSLLGSGCCIIGKDNPRKYHLLVECDDAVAGKTVLVDMVGARKDELRTWESYSVTKYFDLNDPKRGPTNSTDRFTCEFGSGKPRRHVFSLSDRGTNKQWQAWLSRGVSHLVVLADLNVKPDSPGGPDPRRQIVPLTCRQWGNVGSLRIYVEDTGVRIDPLSRRPK